MVELVKSTRVTHVGLFTHDKKKVKELAQRVINFNNKFGTNVKLEIDIDDTASEPTYDLTFTYDNDDVKMKFWFE